MPKNEHIEKYQEQALMLSNKVKKKYKHLHKRYAKQNIDIFRLYDWDIPEVRAVVDWYKGHIVIAEYVRKKPDNLWLKMMAGAVADALNIDMDKVHIKERYSGYQDGNRYGRLADKKNKIVMSERDLKFYINLDDYVDTGLFSDHRNTRHIVRDMAKGKDFLNLYCYTGSFSCYAAKGGARTTVSVDRSETAIQWAKENMELNNISVNGNDFTGNSNDFIDNPNNVNNSPKNILIKAHTFDFLEKAKRKGQMFDIAVVDPPSFSSSRDLNIKNNQDNQKNLSSSRDLKYHFDISQDYPLLLKAVIQVMRKNSDSIIFFSTNHQNFELDINKLSIDEFALTDTAKNTNIKYFKQIKQIEEITHLTIPEDYKTPKKKIHRCWKIIISGQ